MDRQDVPDRKVTALRPPARPSAPSMGPGAEPNPAILKRSFELPRLDWAHAMCAATDRLNEGWAVPETRCHPAALWLEEELAAFLSAYGMLTDEADVMRARAEKRAGYPGDDRQISEVDLVQPRMAAE